MRILLLLFVIVPLSDLYLLLWVSRGIGFWQTVAITLLTGVIGGTLAKREGLRVWRQWHAAIQELRTPETGIVEGVLVLVGGVLLITPGMLTDLVGVILLVPFSRRPIARWLKSRVKTATISSADFTYVGGQGVSAQAAPPRPSFTVVDTSGEERKD